MRIAILPAALLLSACGGSPDGSGGPTPTGPVAVEPDGVGVAARRPGVDPTELAPAGLGNVVRHVRRFVDEGFSKFVLVPIGEPAAWGDELAAVAAEVLPLET